MHYSAPTTDQINAAKAALPIISSALAEYESAAPGNARDKVTALTLLPVVNEQTPLYAALVAAELAAARAAADAAMKPFFSESNVRQGMASTCDGAVRFNTYERGVPLSTGTAQQVLAAMVSLYAEVTTGHE
jgi:membrane protein involved in colicin uptake